MLPELTTILLVVAFIAVLLLVDGARNLFHDLFGGRGAINRRLRLLAQGKDGSEVLATLRRSRNGEAEGLTARLLAWGPVATLDKMLSKAGLTIPTVRFLAYGLALASVLLIVAAMVIRLAWWKALLAAAGLGILLPLLWLLLRGRKRLRRLSEQLPDAIDMIVRSLRAGHPVATAISLVAREMPDPIGTEFGLVFDEMTYGLDLRGALDNLGKRLPVPDLHYLVVAVRVQYGTGGNLAEVLAGLSRVIRDRLRMNTRIRALSAEGRLSATILSALPFVLAGVIFLMRPDYYLKAMVDPAFLPLIGWGVFGIVMGIVTMQRIVNFRF
jgi:tight adherence protein B